MNLWIILVQIYTFCMKNPNKIIKNYINHPLLYSFMHKNYIKMI